MASSSIGAIRLEVAQDVAPELMPLLMNAADCLLHPSESEGSPNVIKEALACNLRIVATAVGDIPERLDGVESSFVCPATAHDLARALRECLDPPRRSNGRLCSTNIRDEVIA